MNIYLDIVAEQEFFVEEGVCIGGDSPQGRFFAFFEQTEETAYFYAGDHASAEEPIQDAVHIYNVASVTDKDKPSVAKVGWSADGLKAMLVINAYPHAIFDFSIKQGYCRTAFPPPEMGSSQDWSRQSHHEWSDDALELFNVPIAE